MCRNGQYTERGIKEIDGYMSERWRIEPEYAIKVDSALGILGVLLEPTTVVAKAWETVEAVGQRSFWEPRNVLVTGAGPIGLLAAMVGVQHGLDVHVLDRVTSGPKPDLVKGLGATYHSTALRTSISNRISSSSARGWQVIADSILKVGAGGIVCLTGVGWRRAEGGHGGPRRGGGAKEQRHCGKCECQQAALVQSQRSLGPRGSKMAGAPTHTAGKTGEFQTGVGAQTR